MPYVRCPRCALLTFSAARWSNVDHCGRCDEQLPHPARGEPRDELRRFAARPERAPTEQH
jgi:rRNA maturation protein Nop10